MTRDAAQLGGCPAQAAVMPPPGTIAAALTVESLLRTVRQLPALPRVVIELMQLFDRDEEDLGAIGARIEKDQAITARVLRLANSPFYGMPGHISTIGEAMAVLGLRNLRNMTVAAGVTSAFPAFRSEWFDADAFWRHSIAAAVAARVICGCTRGAPPAELAFTAGLLHDIGKLALITGYPELYREVLALRSREGLNAVQAERAVLGLDHAVAGAALAQHWKFPSAVEAAIRDHHGSSAAGAEALAGIVRAADFAAHLIDAGEEAREGLPTPAMPAWDVMGGDRAGLQRLLPTIEAETDAAAASLGLCKELPHV